MLTFLALVSLVNLLALFGLYRRLRWHEERLRQALSRHSVPPRSCVRDYGLFLSLGGDR